MKEDESMSDNSLKMPALQLAIIANRLKKLL
jgi:hypothetical protein